MNAFEEATAGGGLLVDLTNGPNPIGTRLLELWPADGEVRRLYGLGNREDLVEPDAVHSPRPSLAIEGDPFPHRASLRALPVVARGVAAAGMFEAGRDMLRARLDQRPTELALTTFVSATPTGSINLRLRKKGENDG